MPARNICVSDILLMFRTSARCVLSFPFPSSPSLMGQAEASQSLQCPSHTAAVPDDEDDERGERHGGHEIRGHAVSQRLDGRLRQLRALHHSHDLACAVSAHVLQWGGHAPSLHILTSVKMQQHRPTEAIPVAQLRWDRKLTTGRGKIGEVRCGNRDGVAMGGSKRLQSFSREV